MSKPCDNYADDLPCCEPGYTHCLGPQQWEHRSYKPKEREKLTLAKMDHCPWIKQVREWWIRHKGQV